MNTETATVTYREALGALATAHPQLAVRLARAAVYRIGPERLFSRFDGADPEGCYRAASAAGNCFKAWSRMLARPSGDALNDVLGYAFMAVLRSEASGYQDRIDFIFESADAARRTTIAEGDYAILDMLCREALGATERYRRSGIPAEDFSATLRLANATVGA